MDSHLILSLSLIFWQNFADMGTQQHVRPAPVPQAQSYPIHTSPVWGATSYSQESSSSEQLMYKEEEQKYHSYHSSPTFSAPTTRYNSPPTYSTEGLSMKNPFGDPKV